MAKKPNPLLAQFEARLEAEYLQRLDVNSEFDMIALVLTVHEELKVGPGRAKQVFDAFLVNKMRIAEVINEDYEDDTELLHTKACYAKLLKSIFSAEDWVQVREFFPLLKEYW